MNLTGAERRRLRALAQPKKTAVRIGKNGVGEGVLHEIEFALARDELIKVFWRGVSREDQESLAERISAHLVGQVGGSVILFRPDPDASKISL